MYVSKACGKTAGRPKKILKQFMKTVTTARALTTEDAQDT